MPAWLFGSVITLLVGAVITAYLWLIRRRDDETAAGLLALAGMRWRDFSRLILEAMELRGLERIPTAHEDNQEHSASFLLSGQGKQWLLACKHGSAYRIGSAAVDEFASEIRLRGVQGGILVTEGVLDKGGVEKAGRYNIEVIDGPLLWPTVKPMVEGNLQRRISGNAASRARRHIGIAWLGAFTLGLASALAFPGTLSPASAPAMEAPAVSAAPPPAAPGTAASNPAAPGPIAAMPAAAPKPVQKPAVSAAATEADTEKHRAEISRKLANTPGITRGVWISRSTLAVDRVVAEDAAWPLVCDQLKAYPDLELTRVQMNPPQGSAEQVRWRQCEAL
ncbi:MAG: restriction endonuclease [Pseudoxanthomonas sp.]